MGEIGEKGRIIKGDSERDLTVGLKDAAEVIFSGGLVAYPTESFYGLAANVTDEQALRRLFAVKRRAGDNPVLILIPSVGVLNHYVSHIPELGHELIKDFWPGGLTLIFEAGEIISSLLTAGTGKIGIRLSSHPVATALAQAVGMPITGTSANLSGQPGCRDAGAVLRSLGNGVDLILDGGKSPGGKGSTILDLTSEPPEVLREGMVRRDELRKVLKRLA